MWGGYGYAQTLIINQILSIFTKGLVVVSVMDTQIDMQTKSITALLREANRAQEGLYFLNNALFVGLIAHIVGNEYPRLRMFLFSEEIVCEICFSRGNI